MTLGDEWLSIRDVATLTGLSERSVWRLIEARELRVYRFRRPRRVMFRRSDVEAWIEAHAEGPRSEPD